MTSLLTVRAPTRIDFGGGWTDVPPYPVEQGGCVCNVAITRYATARVVRAAGGATTGGADDAARHGAEGLVAAAIRRSGLADVDVSLRSDYPIGAGLGGSSAAGVAVVAALAERSGRRMAPDALAEASRTIEIDDLGIAGGRQDHYAAVYGGALGLWFGETVRVRRVPLAPALREELEQRCLLFYTGQSRISGDTITAVLGAYHAREPRVLGALARMKTLAEEMVAALERGDVDALGALVGEHWTHQRALHPAITTERIEAIATRARDAGALGMKALGASGGGCVVVIASRGSEARVRDAVAELAAPMAYGIDEAGVSVVPDDAGDDDLSGASARAPEPSRARA